MLESWEDDDQVHEHTKHKKHSTNFRQKWFPNYSYKSSQTPAPTPTPTQTPVPTPTATQPGVTHVMERFCQILYFDPTLMPNRRLCHWKAYPLHVKF